MRIIRTVIIGLLAALLSLSAFAVAPVQADQALPKRTITEVPPDKNQINFNTFKLNGVVMQSAKLGDMIFGIDEIIAYVSAFTPLAPGDIIATGTPGGVGARREPVLFMKPGDKVEVIIAGIGHLTNVVAIEDGED